MSVTTEYIRGIQTLRGVPKGRQEHWSRKQRRHRRGKNINIIGIAGNNDDGHYDL